MVASEEFFFKAKAICDLTENELRAKLYELNDPDADDLFDSFCGTDFSYDEEPAQRQLSVFHSPRRKKPYQHAQHIFLYIPPGAVGEDLELLSANYAGPDLTLTRQAVKVTLDGIRVAKYPGFGRHEILFDFYAENQIEKNVKEQIHFNAKYSVASNDTVSVIGLPLFAGLNLGTEGILFRCMTVNVKSETDQKFIEFLEDDIFKKGLELSKTPNPLVGLASAMALNLTKNFCLKSNNALVQKFELGLDFNNIASRAPIREGSFFAVQVSQDVIAAKVWHQWRFDSISKVVFDANTRLPIPFNYIIFSVTAERS